MRRSIATALLLILTSTSASSEALAGQVWNPVTVFVGLTDPVPMDVTYNSRPMSRGLLITSVEFVSDQFATVVFNTMRVGYRFSQDGSPPVRWLVFERAESGGPVVGSDDEAALTSEAFRAGFVLAVRDVDGQRFLQYTLQDVDYLGLGRPTDVSVFQLVNAGGGASQE